MCLTLPVYVLRRCLLLLVRHLLVYILKCLASYTASELQPMFQYYKEFKTSIIIYVKCKCESPWGIMIIIIDLVRGSFLAVFFKICMNKKMIAVVYK